jgi:hypothetical protein
MALALTWSCGRTPSRLAGLVHNLQFDTDAKDVSNIPSTKTTASPDSPYESSSERPPSPCNWLAEWPESGDPVTLRLGDVDAYLKHSSPAPTLGHSESACKCRGLNFGNGKDTLSEKQSSTNVQDIASTKAKQVGS